MITEYQKVIHKSRYARYLDSEGRRESWEETVNRYCDYMNSQSLLRLHGVGSGWLYHRLS